MWDTIVKILVTIAVAGLLIGLLPESPFASAIAELGELPFIANVNWFFPVGTCVSILSGWAVCMGAYYAIAWILRQLHIVGN